MEKVSKRAAIKNVLDKLYNKYNHYDLIKPDPLQFVYRYDKPSDREIIALIAYLQRLGTDIKGEAKVGY